MFQVEPLSQARPTQRAQKDRAISPHDIDVVTGPSGPPSSKPEDTSDNEEGGGWLHGNMS